MIRIGIARRLLETVWARLFGFDIFITYTRRDGETYAVALKRALDREYLVFFDASGIQGGQSIPERIRSEIRRCRLHIVVLTPKAVDPTESPWIFKEVGLHFDCDREPRIQTIFFPPNAPHNLPSRLKQLADHKGVHELPNAEMTGSPSIHVLEAIAGHAPYDASEIWARALESAAENPNRAHAFVEIQSAFGVVRQRTRMLQAASAACCLFMLSAIGAWWGHDVAQRRLTLASNAETAEANLRFLEAERHWLTASKLAPWGSGKFREMWSRASERRLLTPAAGITLPLGWRALALGAHSNEWRLLAHRLHDLNVANGRAAFVDRSGWRETIATGNDYNPRVLFKSDAAYLHAAGKITRIPNDGGPRREVDLGLTSYELASLPPQVELGWKAGRLCVLAGLENPPQFFVLNPTTLHIESRTELKLPIDLPTPETERDGSERFGEAIFRLSARDDAFVVATWRRFTDYQVGLVTWGLDLRPEMAAREFPLPMTDIGPVTSPKLETFELSPGDAQIFLRITTFNLFGGTPWRSGRNFWLALDTESQRPPFLMESMISEVWPLPAHQPLEAYYRVDGGDLRALLFPDFVVTARPPVGVLHEVRAASLLPIPQNDVFTLAAATSHEIVLIRDAKPVFRIDAPSTSKHPDARLNRIHADPSGQWLAASFDAETDENLQRLLIWKAGAPALGTALSGNGKSASATQPVEIILTQDPPS